MATEQVKLDLQAVIEACLNDKLQAGFDANSALTVEIARSVAVEIEARAVDYTDEEIAKLKDLIGDGVDLQPIQDFMALMKDLLDGDEETEGFQIFNKLVQDTLDNKQTLITHTTSIALIQSTLATHDATLTDHENRLAALEALDHSEIDCESCHDDMLNIIKDITDSACVAVSSTFSAYTRTNGLSTASSFADELDPVSLTGELIDDGETVIGDIKVSSRRAASVSFNDGTNNKTIVLDANKVASIEEFSAGELIGYVFQVQDAANKAIGAPTTVGFTIPANPVAPEPIIDAPLPI